MGGNLPRKALNMGTRPGNSSGKPEVAALGGDGGSSGGGGKPGGGGGRIESEL